MADEQNKHPEPLDPNAGDPHRLGDSFADPNALDDARIGKNFEETTSSHKKKHHLPHVPKAKSGGRTVWIGLLVFAIIFVIVLLAGLLPRLSRNRQIDQEANDKKNAKPLVEVTTLKTSQQVAGLTEPGTTIPLTEAYVYARASGYLTKRYVDIGDHVKQGQLLALIDSPDLDAQVSQAREQVHQAQQQLEQQKSQLVLATVTVQRYRVLVAKGVFSRQDGDQQEANYASQSANVAAAERNVQAYEENLKHVIALQSYEQVRAPFSGVVTQRNVDVGALISAGSTSGAVSAPAPAGQTSTNGGSTQAGQANNSGTSGSVSTAATPAQSPGQGGPLFGLAQIERLRVLVSVPESYATAIHVGAHAQLHFDSTGSATLTGEITRTSNSIDPNTRTLLTEVQVDNKDGKLIPGMYTVVTFPPQEGMKPPLLVNGEAVIIRHDQSMVATVVNGKIHLTPVTIGRDFGDVVEIQTGLKQGDVVVTSVTDDVVEGAEVRTHETKSAEQKPQAEPKQASAPGGNTQYGNEGITDQNLQGQQSEQNQKANGQKGQSTQQKNSTASKP